MCPSDDFKSKTDAFLTWFKSLPGATFSDAVDIVDLRFRHAGRGLIAIQDIPADTILFTIPRHAIINVETCCLSRKLPSLFESQGDEDDEQGLDSWSGLILIMMYEYLLGDQSIWKAYLDVLPESFETTIFWSDEELSHLQASPSVQKIGRDDAEEMFRARLLPAIRANPDLFVSSGLLTDDDLVKLAHRMGSSIMAYAFDLELEADGDDDEDGWIEDQDGKLMMGMVAMADMLNADAEFNAHVNHGDDELTVTTLRDIKAGEEILNYYGPHPNSELLRRYGYTTDRHSRYDVVEMPWTAIQNSLISVLGVTQDVLTKALEEIEEGVLDDVYVLERECDEPRPDGTFAGAATVQSMPPELVQHLKAMFRALQKTNPDAPHNKRKRSDALTSVLIQTLLSMASQYSTEAAEDEKLLGQEENLSYRQRMALVVRLGEKRLIQEALKFLSGTLAQDAPDVQPAAFKRAK